MGRLDVMRREFHQVVQSFNVVLKEGLDEVPAKYRVAFTDIVETDDPSVHGTSFPANHLKTNYKLEDFKLSTFEFRCLDLTAARNAYRDICRVLGCFEFDDSAGDDLSHLTIFKGGFIRRFIMTHLWQSKPTYVLSLKVSLQHFVEYLESEERLHTAFGGFTTALAHILESLS